MLGTVTRYSSLSDVANSAMECTFSLLFTVREEVDHLIQALGPFKVRHLQIFDVPFRNHAVTESVLLYSY